MASRTHISPWIWNLEYILALRYIITCHMSHVTSIVTTDIRLYPGS